MKKVQRTPKLLFTISKRLLTIRPLLLTAPKLLLETSKLIVTAPKLFLTILLAGAVGCGPAEDQADEPRGRFGSPYEVVTNVASTAPDEPPALISDSLSVMVAYPGGCADHAFTLGSSVDGDTAVVWLRHDDGGDRCEALITERIRVAVPPSVLDAHRIHLVNPNADVPFVLRWSVPPSSSRPTE